MQTNNLQKDKDIVTKKKLNNCLLGIRKGSNNSPSNNNNFIIQSQELTAQNKFSLQSNPKAKARRSLMNITPHPRHPLLHNHRMHISIPAQIISPVKLDASRGDGRNISAIILIIAAAHFYRTQVICFLFDVFL